MQSFSTLDHESVARRLKALGHPVRLAIMDAVRHEPECVCHLECALERPQPYLSQQLRVLREEGLIADEREGTNVYYRVADPEVAVWLEAVVGSVVADLSAGRIDDCPCPKCRAERETCECAEPETGGTVHATSRGRAG